MNIQIRDRLFTEPQVREIKDENGQLVAYLFIEGRFKYVVLIEDLTEEQINYIENYGK